SADLTGFIPVLLAAFLPGETADSFPAHEEFSHVLRPELPLPGWIDSSSRGAERRSNEKETEDRTMLSWVVTFLVIALIAGILGFGGIAGASVEIAKAIFFIAVLLFLISAVVGLARGRTRV